MAGRNHLHHPDRFYCGEPILFHAALFLLAGYFTPPSLEKKGSGPFLVDQLIRLGIPLLVYSTLIWNINVRSEKSSVVIAVASS
jgi:hypothetical protein